MRRRRTARRTVRRSADSVERIELPTEPMEPDFDPGHATGLLYGREKIGKTSFFAQWPETLMLVTEPGTKGLRRFEIPVGNWNKMLSAVAALEREDAFKTVVIDTVDIAYDQCLDHVCRRLGISYPGQDTSGDEDWGKSWKQVRDEFVDAMVRIVRTGRGLWLVSHARERDIRTRFGDRYTRIGPSLGRQPTSVVEQLVDFILYVDYMRSTSGDTMRVIVCEGDETVSAGHRDTQGTFPALLPLPRKNTYDTFVRAFRGEHPGLDPASILPHRTTAQPVRELLRSMDAASRKEGRKKKKSAVRRKKQARRRA